MAWKAILNLPGSRSWQGALVTGIVVVGTLRVPFSPLRAEYPPATISEEKPLQRLEYMEEAPAPTLLPPIKRPPGDRYPIDLAAALRLAGANNIQIALAAERVSEAQARLQGAQVRWIPSLNAGFGYNWHDGQIQDTTGKIIDTRRSSLFAGGGPTLGSIGVAGGSTQPRLFVGLPLADVLFPPLAERQLVQAATAAQASTFNDTLMLAALSYLELVRAQGQVAIGQEAVKNAEELVRLIDSRVRAGTAPPADGLRAQAELAERRRLELQAEETVHVASAELVRLTRLDAAVTLFAVEEEPAAIHLVEAAIPLPTLIAQGIASRPELAANQAVVQAASERVRQEKWRPWLPTVQLGFGAGGYGGGQAPSFGSFTDRTDFDAMAVWELRNLGFGNQALQRERSSQQFQTQLTGEQLRDMIAAEVSRAYYQVQFRHREIEAARAQIKAASEALPLNFKGILGGTLRAIEAQQAIQALASARSQYLATVIDYNSAQLQLLRALGRPVQ